VHSVVQEHPQHQTQTEDDGSILVSEVEAAGRVDMSVPTFRKLVKSGAIQPVLLPFSCRRKLYRVSDLEGWAQSLETGPLYFPTPKRGES
jgi:hypothetical protein